MPLTRPPVTPAPDAPERAFQPLFARLYDDLERVARHIRRAAGPGEEFRTTSLVHEAYLKLARSPSMSWEDERHFVAIAARAMRQLLIDAFAARSTLKRGGDAPRVTLPPGIAARAIDPDAILDLDRALERLSAHDERAARVVELRFFAGLTVKEVASVLDVSIPTVKRDWRMARAWIRNEVGTG